METLGTRERKRNVAGNASDGNVPAKKKTSSRFRAGTA